MSERREYPEVQWTDFRQTSPLKMFTALGTEAINVKFRSGAVMRCWIHWPTDSNVEERWTIIGIRDKARVMGLASTQRCDSCFKEKKARFTIDATGKNKPGWYCHSCIKKLKIKVLYSKE